MSSPSVYSGSEPKLVIAIDIGTTYSGASYTFLKPGEPSKIYDVTGYRGQENREHNTKVPSVLFYSKTGDLIACGAEASPRRLGTKAGIRTEWFKLELRPQSLRIDTPTVHLPPGRDLVAVFGDFLRYMYGCVQSHVERTQYDGGRLWSSLASSTHFVLSHPNGWGSLQQSKMRNAAIRGGLVPDTPEGRERIEFVTEGEASFHWCVKETIAEEALLVDTNIIVADLGGGTIDVSSFQVTNKTPLRLQETLAPTCSVHGSITVTQRFVTSVQSLLKDTKYGHADYMDALREEFDDDTKCLFRDENDPSVYIRVGGRRDHFEGVNGIYRIEYGTLEVPREEVVRAFEPSVESIVSGIQRHAAFENDTHVFLVGGFAANPWVFSEVSRRLELSGMKRKLNRSDTHAAKAVANGAVAFYLDRFVTERTMRFTYGSILGITFDPSNPEHVKRRHQRHTNSISGEVTIPEGFMSLVKKGDRVKVDSEYRGSVCGHMSSVPKYISWEEPIERYSGSQDDISFVDMDPGQFDCIGWFECEMPAKAMKKRRGKRGAYWQAEYDIIITLGTVELKCYIEWDENGVTKRTPAHGIWEDYY